MEAREPYKIHPSSVLNRAFAARPFQGAEPEKARFLFVGLDANYDPKIEESRIFPKVFEYHEDGIRFWRAYGVHHPFLLKDYQGKGKFYHRVFSRIGFRPQQAPQVSFIELLHVPTCNQSKLAPGDLERSHLFRIKRAIEDGIAQYVFVSDRVGKADVRNWVLSLDTEVAERRRGRTQGLGKARLEEHLLALPFLVVWKGRATQGRATACYQATC